MCTSTAYFTARLCKTKLLPKSCVVMRVLITVGWLWPHSSSSFIGDELHDLGRRAAALEHSSISRSPYGLCAENRGSLLSTTCSCREATSTWCDLLAHLRFIVSDLSARSLPEDFFDDVMLQPGLSTLYYDTSLLQCLT